MLNIQDLQMFGLKLKNMSNFHALEVVSRGSETQLQVGENLTYRPQILTYRDGHRVERIIIFLMAVDP